MPEPSKKRIREAVVVIHGIGEQKPMDTLRGFVDSISDYTHEKTFIQVYNVPDAISGNYELRQLSLYYGKELRTDFFEYYWAHKLRGTPVLNVIKWLAQLMLRRPSHIPKRILWLYLMLWAFVVVYAMIATALVDIGWKSWSWTQWPVVALIGTAVANIITGVVSSYMGDASTYTYADPDNVNARNEIKKEGMDLVEKLHQSKLYSRIIIVGHSLGSMIGYDIIKHHWISHYKDYTIDPNHPKQALDEYEKQIKKFGEHGPSDIDAYQKLQSDLLREIQKRGNPWLISDFVTLGSPLNHGELLMARSPLDFKERKEERELPTSPPYPESNGGISYMRPYFPGGIPMRTINHASHFAFVRWCNMYYQSDFVGGPLKKVFGTGIKDVIVTSSSWLSKVPFAMHTCYWADANKDRKKMINSIGQLKEIIFRTYRELKQREGEKVKQEQESTLV